MANPAHPGPGSVRSWERLKAALNATTVSLRSERPGARDEGTGFFVGPGLILTCAHVALPGERRPETIEGVWRRGGDRVRLALSVEEMETAPFDEGRGPDLALLRVVGGAPPGQPCAALSRSTARPPDGQKLHAHGHPSHDYRDGDNYTLEVVGGSWHREGAELLKVAGSELWKGASGAPVIDRNSGCVIGVVRAKQRRTVPTADHETRLVPVGAVWQAFPALREAQRPGLGPLDDWLAMLSDEQLRESGWRLTGPRLRGYLTVLREATARHGYADALHTALAGRGGTAAAPGDIRVPVRARPGHDPEGDDGACRPVLPAELLAGAHIVGEAGTGKSTLLRSVAQESAADWLDGAVGDHVPVYASAVAMARGMGHEAWNPYGWLAYAVGRDLGAAAGRCADTVPIGARVLPLAEAFEEPPYPARRWLLLVDGVDEVGDQEDRRRVEQALVAFARSEHFSVVVTSRDPFRVRGIEEGRLRNLRLCRLGAADRALLMARCLAAFGPAPSEAGAGEVRGELERLGLLELATRPVFCVALCAVYAHSGPAGLRGGRYRLFERLTELLLEAAGGDAPAPVPVPALLSLLAEYAGELREPDSALGPSLDELIQALPERADSSVRPWTPAVREFLYRAGLLAPDSPGDFTHELLTDYFAARRWAARTTADRAAVRRVAEDSMKRHRLPYALFRAAWLVERAPGAVAGELGSWSPRRRRAAAVLVARLAAEAAPVPPELLSATAAVLARWSRGVPGGPDAHGPAPELPADPGWPRWAAAQLPLLLAASSPTPSHRAPLPVMDP
ncbi:trypsin-like peptidase domain-containing protein [Streptomyces sp. NPDC000594]|uniref:serine protease n=1 Tax=Streptomyces sp. NPDC000594 TaxID=3154261 RepID=UPI00331BFEED